MKAGRNFEGHLIPYPSHILPRTSLCIYLQPQGIWHLSILRVLWLLEGDALLIVRILLPVPSLFSSFCFINSKRWGGDFQGGWGWELWLGRVLYDIYSHLRFFLAFR